ncbi:glycosyltransferase family 2 protein [Hymenobacter sp. HD11105]
MSLPECYSFARIPSSPPTIAALAEDVERVLWSVMIPTYNCSAYLREAIRSVLAQDPGADIMQIEVVDDASTDEDVQALVATLGTGRVQYFRQPVNVGSLRNFETCIQRARGHWVHLLHGDDRVSLGFYVQLAQLFRLHPEAGAVFSHFAFINEAGIRTHGPPPVALRAGVLSDWLPRIAEYQRIQYVSIAVRREVYEKVGSFYGTTYGEDWEMWVRIARSYPVAYTPEVLAEYRGHSQSISSQKARAGHLVPDLIQVIARIQQHLPDQDKERIGRQASKHYAYMSIGGAYNILHETKDWSLAHTHIRQALQLSRHPLVYYQLLKFYLKLLVRTP